MLERFPASGTEMLEIFGAELQVEDPNSGWLSQEVLDEVSNRYRQYRTEGISKEHVSAALALALLDNHPTIARKMLYIDEVKKERADAEKNPGYWR